MKLEIVTRYLARLFIREQRNTPTLMRLAAELAEKTGMSDAQPSMVNDIDVGTGQVSPGVMFTSVDQTWLVKVTSESFDVQVSQGFNVVTRKHLMAPPFGDFLKRAGQLFDAAMGVTATKPHRMAIVQSGVLGHPAGGVAALDTVRSRLMSFPRVGEAAPFEWNWRGAWKVTRQFGGCSEPTNTIASLRLSDVSHVERLGDRLVVELDINTDPVNPGPRFTPADVSAFVSKSETWHAELAEAVVSHAGIES